jgi:hypothetical protein
MTAGLLKRIERAEVLARELVSPAPAPDPVALFRPAFGEPDEWQARALRSTSPRLAFNASRQAGKTGVAAVLACHAALSAPGGLVLMLSPGLRQSQEAFRRVLDVYRAAGRPVLPETENRLALELANGSRVVALPGTERTIRGYAGVRLLVIDEAARVLDDLYASVRPMLAVSGGRLVTLSTPWGKRGWWYREWNEGGAGWDRYEVPATLVPRISASFLEEERRSLGDLFYASEYECRFVEPLDNVFSYQDIEAALDDGLLPLWGAACRVRRLRVGRSGSASRLHGRRCWGSRMLDRRAARIVLQGVAARADDQPHVRRRGRRRVGRPVESESVAAALLPRADERRPAARQTAAVGPLSRQGAREAVHRGR